MAVIDQKVSGPKDTSVPEVSGKSKKVAAPKEPTVSLIQLYYFADRHDYLLMLIGSIGAVGHGIAMPLTITFFGRFLNELGTSTNVEHAVNKYVLCYVWMGLLSFASSWIEIAFWMHTGQRQAAKLRINYVEALLRQDVSYFDTGNNTGDVINSIATDTNAVQDAIGAKTGHFLHHLSSSIVSFILAFLLEWRLAVVTLAIIPCIGVTGALLTYYHYRFSSQTVSASSEAGLIAHQAISQIRIVHSFVAEDQFFKSYSDSLQKRLKLGMLTGLLKGLVIGATFFVILCSYGVLFTYGGTLVRQGRVNGGSVLSTIFIVFVGSGALALALSNVPSFIKGQASGFKLFQLMRNKPSINKHDESDFIPTTVEGAIELRNVDFSYASRPDVPVLRDFSLTIPPGKTVAIVGSSGSGKSTVVSLIERFYDPTGGEVLLDGLDVKKVNLKWLRQQIGLVSQEPALFAGTIAANIAYGRDNADQQEIEAAATVANAHSFISQLPQSYETQVGERGAQLSGGQKQRLAIARAIIRNPRILLLDEATSALDTESEHVMQEALDRIMVDRTTVIIAHRLTTIRNADIIAVVERGSIVERGSHHELVSKEDGIYAALVFQQELEATSRRGNPFGGSPDPDSFNSTAHSSHISSISNGEEGSEPTHQAKQQGKATVNEWKGPLMRLAAMTKQDWKYGIAAVIGSTVVGWPTIATAFILARVLLEYYNPNQPNMKGNIYKLSLLSVGIGVAMISVYILQDYSLAVLGERLVIRVREMLFARILRNELGWFDEDENNSNRLAARLGSDAEAVRSALGDRIAVLINTMSILVSSLAIGLLLEWRLALVMSSSLPLITFAVVFETGVLTKLTKALSKAHERATQVAGEAVGNIRTVVAFSAEEKVQASFANELEETQQRSFRKGHIVGFGYGASQLLLFCSLALGLWYAGKLLGSGTARFGPVITAYLILIFSEVRAAEFFTLAPDLVKGGQAVASLFEIIDRETQIEPNDPEGEKAGSVRGDIELKQVTFAYPSRLDFTVLKNMSLKIAAGHSVALVGASGSGKSSVIALMERFYDPISGEVLIDGKDIKSYNLQCIRKHIALVPQEPALFANSIYENIEYGKPGASEAEVIEAAKAANAHSFISSLPEAYKTLVGERGVQLSGGQKQRVAIARAVLKNPSILLLDEATSALDTESEKVVQGAIDRLMLGRTTVIVAHRLSTIRGANSIAVLEDGVVVEEGSHEDLLVSDGSYSRLITIQHRAAAPAAN